jgi:hypothetical protein
MPRHRHRSPLAARFGADEAPVIRRAYSTSYWDDSTAIEIPEFLYVRNARYAQDWLPVRTRAVRHFGHGRMDRGARPAAGAGPRHNNADKARRRATGFVSRTAKECGEIPTGKVVVVTQRQAVGKPGFSRFYRPADLYLNGECTDDEGYTIQQGNLVPL